MQGSDFHPLSPLGAIVDRRLLSREEALKEHSVDIGDNVIWVTKGKLISWEGIEAVLKISKAVKEALKAFNESSAESPPGNLSLSDLSPDLRDKQLKLLEEWCAFNNDKRKLERRYNVFID